LLVVGVGTSSPPAQDAAHRFRSIGVRAAAPVDPLEQHVAAQLLTDGDVCLIVSHSGSTGQTLACVRAARHAGATTAAVTSFDRSPLVGAVDLPVVAGGSGTCLRDDAMASRFAHLVVLDALYLGVGLAIGRRATTALGYVDLAARRQRG
jgi:RpiR family carbohydrate utilization transcriptional regulator